MCGIVGMLNLKAEPTHDLETLKKMTATLHHRGPDGCGWKAFGPMAMGFCRLSIMDLEAVIPPFSNEDATVWSMANAEIYNAAEIQARLEAEGHRFRTRVDTEVIPHLWEDHGPDLVHQINGMFALVVWDSNRQRLFLARDRTGEKPIFYWKGEDQFLFASELRALTAHPAVSKRLDPVALRRFMLHGYFPAPFSPFSEIKKLPAGHTLTVEAGAVTIDRYWNLGEHFQSDSALYKNAKTISLALDEKISKAVARRRLSDVPLGVFLSGGVDSSTILAHMAAQVGEGVPVFSLGHTDKDFDESGLAKTTAQYFKADFHELILGEKELEYGLAAVGSKMDEPLGDASIIPTYLLSCFARKKVKVVLSGEGADELFAGYPTYIGNKVASYYNSIPRFLQRIIEAGSKALAPVSMGNVGLDYLLGKFFEEAQENCIRRHHNWFGTLAPHWHQDLFSTEVWQYLAADDPFQTAFDIFKGGQFPDDLSKLLYTDFYMYLQDNLLTKVDRASMLASLEARAPFLDHELAEFVAGIPSKFKLKGLTTKAILKRSVGHRLPPDVLKRRKRGFNIPFSRWILHGLGQRLTERFSAEKVEARGIFRVEGIHRLIQEHLSSQADHRKPLFALLIFDMWCDGVYGEANRVPIGYGKETSQ